MTFKITTCFEKGALHSALVLRASRDRESFCFICSDISLAVQRFLFPQLNLEILMINLTGFARRFSACVTQSFSHAIKGKGKILTKADHEDP